MRNGLRSVALVTAASLLFSTSGGSVWAAGPSGAPKPIRGAEPSADAARADAEKRLDEGLDRYAKGDFEGARLAFAQAYAVLTSIDLLYNLMRSEVKAGHPLEALVHIHQMLRDPKATTEDHAKAERLLEEANRATGHVAVEAPAGAEILLDHVPSGEAPITEAFDVVPGRHVVEARGSGASSRTIEVDAPAGQIVTARFAVEAGRAPTVSAPVPVLGAPAVPVLPQASPPPQEPVTAAPAPAPQHGRHGLSERVVLPVVIGAVGVAALGVGLGMGVAAQGQQSNAASFRAGNAPGFCANQGSATCQAYAGILNSQQQDTNISRGMLVAGGVLVVAAVVTYLVWPTGAKERSAWVAPTLGGVVAGGTF